MLNWNFCMMLVIMFIVKLMRKILLKKWVRCRYWILVVCIYVVWKIVVISVMLIVSGMKR